MKIYRVGGSVRDELLGLPVVDRDFVVVGATPEAMTARGFKPVGHDFPVFLHPGTHEEYALARTERKSGRGHQGFVFHADPGVTLDEDLARRDLTINAMALDDETGALIDPFGGRHDLDSRVLRHVSPAFAEDPLRVLRVARFAARFGFDVAPETEALMRDIVESGELAELSAERVWRELSLGLVAPNPSRMLSVLRQSGALHAVASEIDALYSRAAPGDQPDLGVAVAAALDLSAGSDRSAAPPLSIQFGIIGRHLDVAAARSLSARIKASNDCRDAATSAARFADAIERADSLNADEWLALLTGIDAQRRPQRMETLLAAVAALSDTLGGTRKDFRRIADKVRNAAAVLESIDFRDIAADGGNAAVRARALRLDALERWLKDQIR